MLGVVRPRMLAFGLAVVGFGARANAEGTDPAAAEQLFMAGRTAMESGDYKTACDRFAESERLDPAAGTLINLADCLDRQGKIASAWQRWKEALDLLRPDDERRAAVTKRAAAMEARLPKLELRLSSRAPAGTVVERDDVELGAASYGISLPVDPGPHRVVVRAPSREPRKYAIDIHEGESSALEVEPGAPTAIEPVRAPAEAPAAVVTRTPRADLGSSSDAKRTWGFVGLGVGAAGLVVGGTAGVLAIMKKQEMDDDCPPVNGALACKSSAGVDAASSGKTFATVANIAVPIGLLGVAAGAYLLLTNDGSKTAAFVHATPTGAAAGFRRSF